MNEPQITLPSPFALGPLYLPYTFFNLATDEIEGYDVCSQNEVRFADRNALSALRSAVDPSRQRAGRARPGLSPLSRKGAQMKALLIAALILLCFIWIIATAGGPESDNADHYPLTPPALQQWGGHGG